MKKYQAIAFGAALIAAGPVLAEAADDGMAPDNNQETAVELDDAELDRITAGSLLLPNDRIVHDGFDNPGTNESGYIAGLLGLCDEESGAFCHPALTRRSDQALESTDGTNQYSVTPWNDGPWIATNASPVISCPDCP